MGFLLDTNVISELRRKHRCDRNVAAWQADIAGHEIFVSVITMMEIRSGVLNVRSKSSDQAELLQEWYETQVKPTFAGRVLSVDLEVFEYCSVLVNMRTRSLADALIAATAYVRNLTLATRNINDFTDCRVKLLNLPGKQRHGIMDEATELTGSPCGNSSSELQVSPP